MALTDEEHVKLMDRLAKFMGQTFDKHERFEALRYLSRMRRGLPVHASHEESEQVKASLTALFSEGKHDTADTDQTDESDADGDVFLPVHHRRLSVSAVQKNAKRSTRLSMA